MNGKILLLKCRLDSIRSRGVYNIYFSEDPEDSDDKWLEGLYIDRYAFKKDVHFLDLKIEWYDEEPEYHLIKKMDEIQQFSHSFNLFTDKCKFSREFNDYFRYSGVDREGFHKINSLYLRKDKLGERPPRLIFVSVIWE